MNVPEEVEQLKSDLVWAKHYLNQYKKLFLYNEKRLALLNKTAPVFFRDIQRMFWDEMIISVSRLMDPYKQKNHKNLSLQILTVLAKENGWDFESEISAFVEEVWRIAKPVIAQRMKRIAHRDLPTAMKEVKLDQVGILEIEEALAFAGKALNLIYLKLTNSTWSWDLIADHDAGELIHYLKLSMIYKGLIEKDQDWQKEAELWRDSEYFDA